MLLWVRMEQSGDKMKVKEMNGLIFCNVKPYTIEVDGKTETVRGEK